MKALLEIIDENQSASLIYRGATQTALTGHELIHHVVHSSKSTKHIQNITIKLDLSKAFDRIEWPYLLALLHKLSFPSHIIYLINQCFSTTKIAVRYNQTRTSYF